jgi:hypothetical protein
VRAGGHRYRSLGGRAGNITSADRTRQVACMTCEAGIVLGIDGLRFQTIVPTGLRTTVFRCSSAFEP